MSAQDGLDAVVARLLALADKLPQGAMAATGAAKERQAASQMMDMASMARANASLARMRKEMGTLSRWGHES